MEKLTQKHKIEKAWHHEGYIDSKRTTKYCFVHDDTIKDSATGEILERVFLIVESTNHLLRGNENDKVRFYNRNNTPNCFMKFWKKYDVFRIKQSMKRMGLEIEDLK